MSVASDRQAIETATRHLAAGRLPEAAELFEEVLRQRPSNTDALCGLGTILLKRGELEQGFELIAHAVALAPADASAVGNLAIAYIARGKLPEAADCVRRALDLDPERASLHATFASVLLALDRTEEALEAQGRAVDLAPASADQRFNLGNILVAANRPAAARLEFEAALDIAPNHAAAINNLALLLKRTGRFESALALLEKARLQDPLNPQLLANRADVLLKLGRGAEALAAVTRAAALSPGDPLLQRSRGAVLLDVGDLAQAGKVLAAVMRAGPTDPVSAGLLAKLMRRQGRLEEAQVVLDHAKSLSPGPNILDPLTIETLLMRGHYPEAWALVNSLARQAPSSRPDLTEDCEIEGKDVRLISIDSSAALFAARFLPSLRARGAVLSVVCPPVLARLFETLTAVDTVVPMAEIDLSSLLEEGDMAVRLDYLPHLLAVTPETPSVEWPLFNVTPATVAAPVRGTRSLVGLWWEGPGPGVALPETLSGTVGVNLVSLQTGSARDDARAIIASAGFVDRGEAVSDFRDLAAEICSLDRVIVSDGPVAHLAAALGVETWVLVDRDGSWYWHGDPTPTPWYPNVRVFRQSVDGSWAAALKAIRRALADTVLMPE